MGYSCSDRQRKSCSHKPILLLSSQPACVHIHTSCLLPGLLSHPRAPNSSHLSGNPARLKQVDLGDKGRGEEQLNDLPVTGVSGSIEPCSEEGTPGLALLPRRSCWAWAEFRLTPSIPGAWDRLCSEEQFLWSSPQTAILAVAFCLCCIPILDPCNFRMLWANFGVCAHACLKLVWKVADPLTRAPHLPV